MHELSSIHDAEWKDVFICARGCCEKHCGSESKSELWLFLTFKCCRDAAGIY